MALRYCSHCGGPLTAFDDHGHTRKRCVWCGRVAYVNPKAAVGAILVRDGRVLLSKRARDPHAGAWDLPGGFLESGEHPEHGLKRELAEETGLKVRVRDLVHVDVGTYGDADTLNLVYACEAPDGEPVAADDAQDLRWCDPADPPGMAFPHEVEALRRWTHRFGGRGSTRST